MAMNPTINLTVLDLPEIVELVGELLELVPDWQHQEVVDRWEAILARAKAKRGD